MPFPALQKAIYRVLKVTKCRKISQIVLSTRVTEIISIDFVVYYWPLLKSGRGAKTFRSPKLKKVWGGGAVLPFRRPCVLSGYWLCMQDMFGASSIHGLSVFYGYPSWIWTNFSIRSHHLFQPSVPTDEAGLHQWRTFNCERNMSQASTRNSSLGGNKKR
jgi:hypothetical protein